LDAICLHIVEIILLTFVMSMDFQNHALSDLIQVHIPTTC